MALRELIVGVVRWLVWEVRPSDRSRLRAMGRSSLAEGWLCFQAEHETRRVTPIPDGWEGWTDDQLRAAWDAAPRVVTRVPLRAPAPDAPPAAE